MRNFLLIFFVLLLSCNDALAQIVMSGKVVTTRDEALVGALLVVEDTDLAALSDNQGYYVLKIPEQYAGKMVSVSYYGYKNLQIPVEEGTVNVVLTDRPSQLVDEVTVSTQKRAQREVEVPIAMTVLTTNRMRLQNYNQIDEMSFFIPALQNNFQDYATGVYGIRGVTSDGIESYAQQRISVYLDNISIGRLQTSIIEPLDLARVEVVRGPQGTLFGRGALVGAVQYVRNKPARNFDFNVMANYGAYNQRGGELMLNTPWGSRVSNRLAFRYDAHDGYIKNLAGGSANGKSAFAIKNATSVFLKDSSSAITLTLDMLRNNNSTTSFKTNRLGTPDDPDNKSPFTAAYFNGGDTLGLDRSVYNAILQYDGRIGNHLTITNTIGARYYDCNLGFDVDGSYRNILLGYDIAKGHQLSEELRLNWDNGKNLSGFFGMSYVYEYNEHQYILGGNMGFVFPIVVGPKMYVELQSVPDLIGLSVVSSFNDLADQVKAAVPGADEQVDALMATFMPLARKGVADKLRERYDKLYRKSDHWEKTPDLVAESADVIYDVLGSQLKNIMDSNPQVGAIMGAVMGEASLDQFLHSLRIEDQLAQNEMLSAISNVYLPDDYYENATDKCKTYEFGIFADLTWNFWRNLYFTVGLRGTDESMRTGYFSTSDVAPIINQSLLLTSSNGQQLWTERKYRSWVGRAVLNWKFDARHNVYASASKGRRPAQVYYDLRPDIVVELRPEHLYNYEIGVKGISQNGYFNYNVANYYYVWHHFQSTEYGMRPDGSVGYITNDKGRARGFGIDGSLIYKFGPKLTTFIDYTFCNGRFADKDMDDKEQELKGNRFRLNPEHKFDVGFNITHQFGGPNKVLHIHPSVAFVGKYYFSEPNVSYLRQDAYSMANLNVGYQWTDSRNIVYDISLYGKNLFNSKYCVDAGNSGDVFGYPTYVAGAPLTFGVVFRAGLSPRIH
ncbi:MAG: TonB-dependent receptor [Bacteroidales bacterium]|nr:TonB-dependent receptor [Bacteroidales bacterium]